MLELFDLSSTFIQRKILQAEKLESLQTSYELASANAVHMKQMQEKLVESWSPIAFKVCCALAIASFPLSSARRTSRRPISDDLDALFTQYEKSTNAEDELAAIKQKINSKES
jgi:phage shock protein A